jgi:hypothetical protein
MDEGSGTTAFDSTNITNDGTITGSTWVAGQYGTALDLDGSDDVVTVTNADPIDFDVGLKTAVTFSAWINADSDGENNVGEIIDKGSATFLRVDTETSGKLDLQASLDLATADATLNVSSALNTNQWHHVAMVYEDDGDDEISLYVDGVNVGVSTDGDGAPASTDTNNLLIGGDTAANFDGTIDDVRVYGYARTADEIRLDYNAGLGARFGGSPNQDITRGLIGYWNFDDGAGTNANDASDSNNDGTLTNMDPPTDWVAGKAGNGGALDFAGDADDDFVSIANESDYDFTTGDYTIAVWVYSDAAQVDYTGIVSKTAGGSATDAWGVGYSNASDKGRFFVNTTTGYHEALADSDIPTGQWVHLVGRLSGTEVGLFVDGVKQGTTGTISGTRDANNGEVEIGRNTQGGPTYDYFDGKIDEVRIYNRAITEAEVRYLYNKGGPIAHYKMDEGSGTTAFDSTNITNDGTITGSTWVAGQYGTALDLDGSDDVVTVTNADPIDFDVGLKTAVTFSAWINADSDGENDIGQVFYKGDSIYLRADNESSGSLDLEGSMSLASASATLNVSSALKTNTWHHVAMTYEDDSDDEISLYVDGKFVGVSTDGSGSPTASDTGNLLIGGVSTANFDGIVDDARVYGYARTADEIRLDYNAGLAARFGGSPNQDVTRGLVGYWNFEDGVGTNANDSSDQNNDGTLKP